jgi:hypothetical protein
MSALGELVPSTETRKKKRGSGFRFSSKKVIDRSRLAKKTAKTCGSEFTTVAKALVFSSELSSETDHPDCATSSGGQPLLHSVPENDGVMDMSSFANLVSEHLQWVFSN